MEMCPEEVGGGWKGGCQVRLAGTWRTGRIRKTSQQVRGVQHVGDVLHVGDVQHVGDVSCG